jgi:hypothetical protein
VKHRQIIGCLLAGALCTGPAMAQELTGTLKNIKDTGAITLGFRDSSIPFSYLDDNQKPIGYAMDICYKIVDAVKKELKLDKLEVKLNPVTSSTRIPLLANGTIDLECGSTTNNLERQKQVSEFGGITGERLAAYELDARTKVAQMRGAELALQRSEYELEAARAILRQFAAPSALDSGAILLRPPIDGTVLRVHQQSEAPVAAGTPLIEVGNPHQLEIVSDFLSTEAVKIQPGFPVLITGWGGGPAMRGRVRLVEPAGFTKISALGVEEQRVNVVIDFDEAQSDASKLGDGFRVEVSIIVWERGNVLKVPTSALFRDGDAWAVFAVRGGRAARTAVRIGQRSALDAEILSGLEQGVEVLVHPGDTVADGVAVVRRQ